jgi:hypothetical protein
MENADKDVTLILDPLMLSRLKHFVGWHAFSGAGNKNAEDLYAEIMRQCHEQKQQVHIRDE